MGRGVRRCGMSFTLVDIPNTPTLDAYVTLAEMDTYFAGNNRATALLALTVAQRTSLLNQATLAIDSTPFRGTKYDTSIIAGIPNQKRAFPRIIDGVTLDYNSITSLAIVPQVVEYACMEEALAIQQAGVGGRKQLQDEGVQSFTLAGKLSESFVPGAGAWSLQSKTARQLLRPYMGSRIR
jgi:hypothetical protein